MGSLDGFSSREGSQEKWKSRERHLGAFRLAGADAQRMRAALSKSETPNTMLAFLEPSVLGNNAFDFVKRAAQLKCNA